MNRYTQLQGVNWDMPIWQPNWNKIQETHGRIEQAYALGKSVMENPVDATSYGTDPEIQQALQMERQLQMEQINNTYMTKGIREGNKALTNLVSQVEKDKLPGGIEHQLMLNKESIKKLQDEVAAMVDWSEEKKSLFIAKEIAKYQGAVVDGQLKGFSPEKMEQFVEMREIAFDIVDKMKPDSDGYFSYNGKRVHFGDGIVKAEGRLWLDYQKREELSFDKILTALAPMLKADPKVKAYLKQNAELELFKQGYQRKDFPQMKESLIQGYQGVIDELSTNKNNISKIKEFFINEGFSKEVVDKYGEKELKSLYNNRIDAVKTELWKLDKTNSFDQFLSRMSDKEINEYSENVSNVYKFSEIEHDLKTWVDELLMKSLEGKKGKKGKDEDEPFNMKKFFEERPFIVAQKYNSPEITYQKSLRNVQENKKRLNTLRESYNSKLDYIGNIISTINNIENKEEQLKYIQEEVKEEDIALINAYMAIGNIEKVELLDEKGEVNQEGYSFIDAFRIKINDKTKLFTIDESALERFIPDANNPRVNAIFEFQKNLLNTVNQMNEVNNELRDYEIGLEEFHSHIGYDKQVVRDFEKIMPGYSAIQEIADEKYGGDVQQVLNVQGIARTIDKFNSYEQFKQIAGGRLTEEQFNTVRDFLAKYKGEDKPFIYNPNASGVRANPKYNDGQFANSFKKKTETDNSLEKKWEEYHKSKELIREVHGVQITPANLAYLGSDSKDITKLKQNAQLFKDHLFNTFQTTYNSGKIDDIFMIDPSRKIGEFSKHKKRLFRKLETDEYKEFQALMNVGINAVKGKPDDMFTYATNTIADNTSLVIVDGTLYSSLGVNGKTYLTPVNKNNHSSLYEFAITNLTEQSILEESQRIKREVVGGKGTMGDNNVYYNTINFNDFFNQDWNNSDKLPSDMRNSANLMVTVNPDASDKIYKAKYFLPFTEDRDGLSRPDINLYDMSSDNIALLNSNIRGNEIVFETNSITAISNLNHLMKTALSQTGLNYIKTLQSTYRLNDEQLMDKIFKEFSDSYGGLNKDQQKKLYHYYIKPKLENHQISQPIANYDRDISFIGGGGNFTTPLNMQSPF